MKNILSADEYQKLAVKTMSNDYKKIRERLGILIDGTYYLSDEPNRLIELLHAGMGICTEGGEFFDPIKKHIMYGKELDTENLCEELGDILWYVAVACVALDINMSVVMAKNIKKLHKRYPSHSFTETAARERKDKNEKDK